MDGATTLGLGTLNASGQTAFTASSLPAGSHLITATYAGGGGFSGSMSVLTQTVNKATTTTKVTSSLNPSLVKQG
jgi:Bacterial Ig-like domain (group 3)